MTLRILFIWKVRDELKDYLLKGTANLPVTLIFPEDLNEQNLISLAENCEIIVGWRPSPELLTSAKKFALYINPGAGVKKLLQRFSEASVKHPFTIVNGHGNNYFTAQHTVAILLSLMNKVIPHHGWMVEGKWRTGDKEATSLPLRGRRVGFLGYGHINQLVHQFLSGFDINFSIMKKDWDDEEMQGLPAGCQKFLSSEMDQFLSGTDILIVALPHTDLTEGLIGIDELNLLGPDGIVVNIGRGKVVNEQALFEALQNKKILGAAIDVWYNYETEADASGKKYPYSYPFHELDNIVLSPHRAASPMSDLGRWDEVIENIRRFASNERPFLNEVDVEAGY